MTKRSIGIFTAKNGPGGQPVSFFGCDDTTLMAALYQHATEVAGPDMAKYDPEGGMEAKRVGEIIVQPVVDDLVYKVDAAVGKPEVDRAPDGEVGTWAIQSLIFSKDNFTADEAKAWISEHSDRFGNYGVEETDTALRFRQYDPSHFEEFRTVPLADGITAVYGKISGEKQSEDTAKKALEKSVATYAAVRKINEGILKYGVRILCKTAATTINKAADGTEEEERYVLSMVLEPNDGESGAKYQPDTQGDIYSKEDVRKACHTWMEHYGAVDLMHSWKALGKQDVRVLECYIAPVEFKNGDDIVAEGSWMLAVRIANDELWESVKAENIGAYSIGGTANRVPLETV